MTELQTVHAKVVKAKYPEDVFGTLTGAQTFKMSRCKKLYHEMAMVLHEDRYTGTTNKRLAHEGFIALQAMYTRAQATIRAGDYGKRKNPSSAVLVTTKTGEYNVGELYQEGDSSRIYACNKKAFLFKVAKTPKENARISNEAKVLKELRSDPDEADFFPYFPELVESLDIPYKPARTANVIVRDDKELFTLQRIYQAYPNGVDPRDMAWMWRRLLSAIAISHAHKIIHGAILPVHVMMRTDNHGAVICGWSSAGTKHEPLKAWAEYYPPEFATSRRLSPATDIFMGAKCMVKLLGGDPKVNYIPATVPTPIRRFLEACLIQNPTRRAYDALQLHEDFGDILVDLYGPPKFRVFTVAKVA